MALSLKICSGKYGVVMVIAFVVDYFDDANVGVNLRESKADEA